jgi:hypothetical protein
MACVSVWHGDPSARSVLTVHGIGADDVWYLQACVGYVVRSHYQGDLMTTCCA